MATGPLSPSRTGPAVPKAIQPRPGRANPRTVMASLSATAPKTVPGVVTIQL
jgi:hypothetical protein